MDVSLRTGSASLGFVFHSPSHSPKHPRLPLFIFIHIYLFNFSNLCTPCNVPVQCAPYVSIDNWRLKGTIMALCNLFKG